MPTAKYTALANITLGSSASEVNFSSISQSYRDLMLVINGTVLSGTATVLLGINGSSSTIYWNNITGNGSTASWGVGDGTNLYTSWTNNNMTTTGSVVTINAMDYSLTNKHKTFLIRSAAAANSTTFLLGRQTSTSAISSLRVFLTSSSFATGTIMALYGVK